MVLLAASAWQCLSSGNAAPSAQKPQSRAELTRLWRYFSWKGESNSVSHLFPVLLGLADLWFSPSSCLVPSFLLGHRLFLPWSRLGTRGQTPYTPAALQTFSLSTETSSKSFYIFTNKNMGNFTPLVPALRPFHLPPLPQYIGTQMKKTKECLNCLTCTLSLLQYVKVEVHYKLSICSCCSE